MPEQKVPTITSEDIAIVSLKALITDLNLQSNQLTSQISDFSEAARNGIRMRNRVSAMRALRSRKLAEQSLAGKLSNLSQLQGAYDQIEQAVDQVALIAAMKSTTQVLRGLHSETGGVESVENVMEELQTEILESDGINNAMKEADQEINAVDDEAIDAELEVLIHDAKLSNDDKQIQDIAARLDSISPLGKLSPAVEAQPKNTPAAAIPIHPLPDQGNPLETEITNSIT